MRERVRGWWKQPSSKWWVIGAIASPFLIWLLWWLWVLPDTRLRPDYSQLTDNERAALAHQYRGTLIGGVGTIATVVGGIFLYLNFRVANKNAETACKNLEMANKRLDLDTRKIEKDATLAEDRLISERVAKAVEQLGYENSIHIRLGGIYSLRRLAKDSKEMRQTVIDVLAAFIRENHPKHETPSTKTEELSEETEKTSLKELATDVNAALTSIWAIRERKESIDLRNISFSNTNLRGAKLNDAKLTGVDFSYANLNSAILSGADLSYANLSYANLIVVILNGANLSGADLSNDNLNNANLSNANLSFSDLSGANLSRADLSVANLINVNLSGANLSRTDLSFAALYSTNLNGTNLSCAILRGTILFNVNLSNADVSNADLNGANLGDADLSNARNLSREQLDHAILCRTKLPKGINLNPDRDCPASE